MGNAIGAEFDKEMDGQVRFHRFRYHLGSGFCTIGDVVLDLGCGQGYGSEILAEKSLEVRAYDKEQANIDYAKVNHQAFNIVFTQADIETIEIDRADVACSFEVIEHLYNPKSFINKLKEKINKYIVVSVPLGQKLVWNEEAKENQEEGDSTHHSVFATPDEFNSLFVDDTWKEFYSYRDGVTYLAVFYNNKNNG